MVAKLPELFRDLSIFWRGGGADFFIFIVFLSQKSHYHPWLSEFVESVSSHPCLSFLNGIFFLEDFKKFSFFDFWEIKNPYFYKIFIPLKVGIMSDLIFDFHRFSFTKIPLLFVTYWICRDSFFKSLSIFFERNLFVRRLQRFSFFNFWEVQNQYFYKIFNFLKIYVYDWLDFLFSSFFLHKNPITIRGFLSL